MAKTKPILALLDGDIFAYRAAAAAQQAYEWEPGQWTFTGDQDKAERHLEAAIQFVKERLGDVEMWTYLSDDTNFRKDLWPQYKANRKTVVRPALLGTMKEYIGTLAPAANVTGVEADDLLGIKMTDPDVNKDYRPVCVSIDKDLLMIPGRHFNYINDEKTNVTEEAGLYMLYTQTLTGDSTDNYPGCPGIGPTKAEAIITRCGEVGRTPWEAIVHAYENAKMNKKAIEKFGKDELDEDDAINQARLARILHHSDWDSTNQCPILWTPSSNP